MRLEEERMFRPSLKRATTSNFLLEEKEQPVDKDAMLHLEGYSNEKLSSSTEESPPESPSTNSGTVSLFKKCDLNNNNLFS
jgi:hypothetical protein